jgi:hypothetical protein
MRLEKSRSLEMDSDSVFNVQQELARMRRAVRLTQWLILALALLVVVLLVALAAVGGTQGRLIRGLKRREGLLDYPNVTFASNSGYRNVDGLTYGGSLFRGSGFWAAKTSLPGTFSVLEFQSLWLVFCHCRCLSQFSEVIMKCL